MNRALHGGREAATATPLGDGQDDQVFVDDSGRRARGVRILSVVAALLCTFWLSGLIVGMAGFSGFPIVNLPVIAHIAATRPGIVRGAPDSRLEVGLGEDTRAGSHRDRAHRDLRPRLT